MPYGEELVVPEWLQGKWSARWAFELELDDALRRYMGTALQMSEDVLCYCVNIEGAWCKTKAGAWHSLDAAMRWAHKPLGGQE